MYNKNRLLAMRLVPSLEGPHIQIDQIRNIMVPSPIKAPTQSLQQTAFQLNYEKAKRGGLGGFENKLKNVLNVHRQTYLYENVTSLMKMMS